MNNDEIIKYDKRSFFKIFLAMLFIRHDLSYSFAYPTISVPFHLRISYLTLNISISFCLNAILFSDKLIEDRNLESNKVLATVFKL
jgi:hypothetical protein